MIETLITSSVLIVVILLFRYLLRGKISLRLQYALWALVAIRLLLPFPLLSSPISVMNAFDIHFGQQAANTSNPVASSHADAREHSTEVGNAVKEINESAENEAATLAKSESISIAQLLRIVWLYGIGFTALCLIAANMNFYRKLKKQAVPVEVADCPLPVYRVETLPSPCLYGVLRPAIYLTPESLASKESLRHILAHELTHYAHKDHLWAFLRSVCIAVHWYNPLVWAAAIWSRRDCELACDEGTLLRLGEDSRVEYGRTLIGMMTSRRTPLDLLHGATTMTSGKAGIKERISLIAKKPKMLAVTLATVVVIVIVTIACTFTGAIPKSGANASKPPASAIGIPSPTLDASITEAIIAHNDGSYTSADFKTAAYVALKTEEDDNSATVYLIYLYTEYKDTPDGYTRGESGPAVISFTKDSSGAYQLADYWKASDGSYYESSIREKFPVDISDNVFQMKRYSKQLNEESLKRAQEYFKKHNE